MNQTENQKKNCQLSRKQWKKKDKKFLKRKIIHHRKTTKQSKKNYKGN